MRKNAKRFFMSAALVVTLCMFTACGNNNNNAADEVETEDNTMTDENEPDNVYQCHTKLHFAMVHSFHLQKSPLP